MHTFSEPKFAHGGFGMVFAVDISDNRKEKPMDDTTIIDAAEKLRKCADELAEIAKSLAELACVQPLRCKMALPVANGKTVDGNTIVEDIATIPHLFVGGASGQRKSHLIHLLLYGLTTNHSSEEVQFIIAGSKHAEYSQYAGIAHLVVPIITDNRKIVFALHWAVAEMGKRLRMFARARVRNIADFNSRTPTPDIEDVETESLPKTVPYIVIVIDDFADAMETVGDEIEPDVSRLAVKARAVGIHLVLVTQRPDDDVLSETVKANISGRITFRTVLKKRGVKDDVADDDFQRALECIRATRRASISHFQRWLGYGYKHAADLIDRLEHEGYVEPPHGSGPRKINWEKVK